MPAPEQPTLLYPVGGEKIETSSLVILWDEPSSGDVPAFIEIRAGNSSDIFFDDKSYVIGRIIPGIKRFVWNIPPRFSGSDIRVSIKSVSIDGSRSAASVSFAPLSILKLSLPSPILVSPKNNDLVSSSALITFDDSPYEYYGNDRVQYYIYASSEKAEANYIVVAENVPVGTPSLSWNIEGLKNANDWYLNVFAADDSGLRSSTVNVGPLTLGNPGFFILDTEPPDVSVRVQNDEFYTRKRDISVQVYSSDDATSIHAMRIIEKAKSGSSYSDNATSPPKAFASDVIFQLTDKDEKKYISIFAQDYGANRNDLSNSKDFFSSKQPNFFRELLKLKSDEFFRSFKYEDGKNRFFASIGSSSSMNDTIVSISQVGVTTLAIVSDPVIAIGIDGENIYVSVGNQNRSMDVKLISSGILVSKFSNEIFGTEVTAIGSDSFGNLFLGCADGKIYRVSGSSIVLLGTLAGSVTSIVRGSGGSAFVGAGNANSIYLVKQNEVIAMEVTL